MKHEKSAFTWFIASINQDNYRSRLGEVVKRYHVMYTSTSHVQCAVKTPSSLTSHSREKGNLYVTVEQFNFISIDVNPIY
jgi:hypothetical protein